ncbi:MAG TPA: Asp-tRNA(Asn)/Glu-tRNA(Gln) amidotransferase subunit GatA [Candidatus Omnitrophica bacterium]|nr:Asp-tRNA(Asn)/Glu-tRNA(Gln) amidotransferase subunit GatA [Candidatus Omnitrophota bacterium]
MELYELTAHQLHKLLIERKTSSFEVTKSIYERIEKLGEKINSYITLTTELALKQAEKADEKLKKHEGLGPLTGIPVAIKDVISTKGVRTTCGSKILSNYVPIYDATVIERLRGDDAVFLGKTNMDEFAMGSSNENSAYGCVRNPWDTSVIPGGSSGGSAASVASDLTIMALGTDTGGSIRQPASMCGIVGLKPTYGRVSRFGLVAFASSLDQIGPITKDVEDASLLLNVIAGYDPMDSTSIPGEIPDYTSFLRNSTKNLRIGVPQEYFVEGIDKEVERAVLGAVELFKKLGAEVMEVSLPHTEYAVSAYYIIAPAEASSNLARYDGVQYGCRTKEERGRRSEDVSAIVDMYEKTRDEGFGDEVKRRIMLGTYALSKGFYEAYYLKALKVRTLIKNDFEETFKKCDVIFTPTSPTPAFKIGEKISDPLQMYLSDIFTIPVNLAGLPAISIPCGFSSGGLPIGLQIIGKPFDEGRILQVAYTFEQNTDYHTKKPQIS